MKKFKSSSILADLRPEVEVKFDHPRTSIGATLCFELHDILGEVEDVNSYHYEVNVNSVEYKVKISNELIRCYSNEKDNLELITNSDEFNTVDSFGGHRMKTFIEWETRLDYHCKTDLARNILPNKAHIFLKIVNKLVDSYRKTISDMAYILWPHYTEMSFGCMYVQYSIDGVGEKFLLNGAALPPVKAPYFPKGVQKEMSLKFRDLLSSNISIKVSEYNFLKGQGFGGRVGAYEQAIIMQVFAVEQELSLLVERNIIYPKRKDKKRIFGAYVKLLQDKKVKVLSQADIKLIQELFDLRDGIVHNDERDLANVDFPLSRDSYNKYSVVLKKLYKHLVTL
ncbi:hypothetical protein [Halobacteriovorax sp. JY17]|uniref:hypothetical protein n=1 Tax=Halobacteriovorax sp. JY17 TaxID=2014617 RepID=UPI000C3B98D5|nr:hypothetical protein [Halobacteriovorax sp. JY17]PIK15109.1 MAG: hypothetical protein CES88_12310 [Halobacteriovorax sp. JY17]